MATVIAATGLLLSACNLDNMQFTQDHRVRIVEPEDRSTVTLPVTVRWEVDGFEVTGKDGKRSDKAGYFAVFVDREPIPPGKTLEWYANQESSCGSSACGSVDNLADIYTTKKTKIRLKRLPATDERDDVERHEVTVILLDGTGARISESAFYVRFNYRRGVL
ncbi:hypothetical protein [Haloechinothrix salitolerans]|uniref:Lipoprotein n=1 Tax=Haloechinothrix salitolerans TaxID=926830 RepID=A0ABW2BVL9_9PSEU